MSSNYDLTAFDKTAAGMGICFAAVLVYRERVDLGKLQAAVEKISELHPTLASRCGHQILHSLMSP
jgi:hypothetical protein